MVSRLYVYLPPLVVAFLSFFLDPANRLIGKTAGAVFFVTDLLGWYIFTFLMLASVEFPIQLPMGDISHLIPPRRVQGKEE